MRTSPMAVALLAAGLLTGPAANAASYNFDVLYSGGGVDALQSIDDPRGLALNPTDEFTWNIKAAGTAFWQVNATNGYFPLMGFGTLEGGLRSGDFTLTLWRNGGDVFSLVGTGVETAEVHIGTNTVNLLAGLTFDRMTLQYTLLSALDLDDNSIDVSTTLSNALVPIFGAPDRNLFAPGIVYVDAPPVPLPAAAWLLLSGLGGLGFMGRRRKTS